MISCEIDLQFWNNFNFTGSFSAITQPLNRKLSKKHINPVH